MKVFYVRRHADVSGVSGTGIVAEGVQFARHCVVVWNSKLDSIEITPDVDTFLKIHGHDGKTVVEWSS
jgi:hypothetical protein